MAITVADLRARMGFDASEFKRGVRDAQRSSENLQGRLNRNLGQAGRSMQSFGKKASVGLTLPLVAAGKAAFSAASDLAESQNAVQVAFEESAKGVETWAKDLDSAYGFTQRGAMDAAAGFRLVTKASDLTATEITRLAERASDLGSVFNVETTEAANALKSALVGEFEPARRLGVILNAATIEARALSLGFKAVGGELPQAAKQAAIYAEIMEQTSFAQGDATKTADTAAGKLRVMRADVGRAAEEIGQNLLPAVSKVVGFVSDLSKQFAGLSPEMQTAVVTVGALAAAIGPISVVAGTALRSVTSLTRGFSRLGATGTLALAGIGALLVTVAKGLLDARQAGQKLVDDVLGDVDTTSLEDMRARAFELGTEIQRVGEEGRVAETGIGQLSRSVGEFGELVTPLPNKLAEAREKVSQGADAFMELDAQIKTAQKAVSNFAHQSGLSVKEVQRLAKANSVDLTGSYVEISGALRDAHLDTREMSVQLDGVTVAAEDAEDALKGFNDQIDTLLSNSFGVQDSLDRMEQRYIDLTESIGDNGTALQGNAEEALNNREALRGIVERIGDVIRAQADAGASSDELAASLEGQRQRFIENLTQLGFNREAVEGYAEVLGQIPTDVSTFLEVDTAGANASIDQLSARLRDFGGGQIGVQMGAVRFFSHGGIVDRPTLSMIGEAGPEAVLPLNKPRRMAEIMQESGISFPAAPAGGGGAAGGGGTGTTIIFESGAIRIDAPLGDPVKIGEHVQLVLNRAERKGFRR